MPDDVQVDARKLVTKWAFDAVGASEMFSTHLGIDADSSIKLARRLSRSTSC